jgi:hypothetical protein
MRDLIKEVTCRLVDLIIILTWIYEIIFVMQTVLRYKSYEILSNNSIIKRIKVVYLSEYFFKFA